jgi:hypothetical protein
LEAFILDLVKFGLVWTFHVTVLIHWFNDIYSKIYLANLWYYKGYYANTMLNLHFYGYWCLVFEIPVERILKFCKIEVRPHFKFIFYLANFKAAVWKNLSQQTVAGPIYLNKYIISV